jgi:23S rRNA pseudouridine1911/1915/1917 synthase
MIINKPYNLTTHKAPSEKNPTLQEWLTFKGKTLSTIYGKEREGIVHRLDKPTSGAIVVAKNNEAHLNLSNQLQNKSMGRYYLGIIDKTIKDDILVDKALGRLRNNRIKFSVNTALKKRDAASMFCKIANDFEEKNELIAIKLFTGRTHQIRAHLESINRHLIGDTLYGYKGDIEMEHRIFLHAYLLFLVHPRTGKQMTFKANLHNDMSLFLDKNFNKREIDEKISSDNIINGFDIFDKRMYEISSRWKKT